MNSTTPALLSSTSALRVVLTPSLVSISPPKPSRLIVSPTAGLAASDEPLVVLATTAATFSLTASLTLVAALAGLVAGLAVLVVFLRAGGAGGGAGASLRLRSSIGMMGDGGMRYVPVGYAQLTAYRKDRGVLDGG